MEKAAAIVALLLAPGLFVPGAGGATCDPVEGVECDVPFVQDATLPPTDGKYLERPSGDVYFYWSLTKKKSYVHESEGETSASDQRGECRYVGGDWADPGTQYTYGACINLRDLGTAAREYIVRFDARQITGPTLEARIGVQYYTQGGSELPAQRKGALPCSSGSVQNCGRRVPDQISVVPQGAATYCLNATVYEIVNGVERLYLPPVFAPCRPV